MVFFKPNFCTDRIYYFCINPGYKVKSSFRGWIEMSFVAPRSWRRSWLLPWQTTFPSRAPFPALTGSPWWLFPQVFCFRGSPPFPTILWETFYQYILWLIKLMILRLSKWPRALGTENYRYWIWITTKLYNTSLLLVTKNFCQLIKESTSKLN